jgi:hypothetical protein
MIVRHKIPGEYAGVSIMTSEPELLRIAHEHFITREQALVIVREKRKKLPVHFKGFRGRCPKHKLYIALPDERRISPNGIIGRLRVGIVLHEMAHFFNSSLRHDQEFVDRLDVLLDWFYRLRTPNEVI